MLDDETPAISSVETFFLSPRLALVRIETDDGLVGWGEPVLEGRTESVLQVIAESTPLLLGEPAHPARLWQRLFREGFYRGGPVFGSAIAGIDQALWDLLGKRSGLPVHELLGGPVRDTLTVYAPCHGETPERLRDRASELADAGYRLMKTSPLGPRERFESPAALTTEYARAAAVREAIGDDRGFAIDFHGRLATHSARSLLAALEPLRPAFVEEPIIPELQHELPRITAGTTIPIATGERLYDRWEVSRIAGTGISLLQPDLSHCHGISEAVRIAAVASLHDVSIAPHCATGPVALAACVQFAFASHEVTFQECQLDLHEPGRHPSMGIVDPTAFTLSGGSLARPTAPGLGIEVEEERVRAWAADPDDVPLVRWQHHDGSHAEW